MQAEQTTGRRIVIDPLSRVEGHGKVTIQLDGAGQVVSARLHIVEFRGFERFIQGRPFWEVPVLVQRLCGICPVSHHLAAAKALDAIVGAKTLTPTAEKMRRLMHYGQTFQSHALHFFHLASPDLLFGFDADVGLRNILGVATHHKALAIQGVMMRKFGQELVEATSGKRIHGTGAIPGGINKNLSIAERDRFLRNLEQMLRWSSEAVGLARRYTLDHLEQLRGFACFPSNYVGLVQPDGTLDLYDGAVRAVDEGGATIFDQMPPEKYLDYFVEGVRSWSYMKFPFIASLGADAGWYRVGPLARMNVCTRIDTPAAEAARREFCELTGGAPNHMTMAYHWARMVELLHACEKIEQLLHDADLQGEDLVVGGPREEEGVAIIEAPRGTLVHHYRVDDNDLVTMANLIVSTTSNNEALNRSVTQVAKAHLSGVEISEGLLNHIEVAIRAYDPCLSCATHALGQMSLVVSLRGPAGELLDRRARA